jgi:putative RNA 2'-phosphotransferase
MVVIKPNKRDGRLIEHRVRISKFLSYILRHNPAKFNLRIDQYGYADISDILSMLKQRFPALNKEGLFELVSQDSKGRFEIIDDKIRATYGHSIAVKLPNQAIKPPEFLYHGTSKKAMDLILEQGLKPMRRQFVHLSQNREDAIRVGLRHTPEPVILNSAQDAYSEGIEFFKQANTYLAKFIPKQYISQCEE